MPLDLSARSSIATRRDREGSGESFALDSAGEQVMQYRYRVYIIDLKKAVLKSGRFRAANTDYIEGKPCVYVGSTAMEPANRLEQHLMGYRSNTFARKYGRRLRENDMRGIRPRKSRESIERKEAETAAALRAKGWGVWSN